LREEAEAAKSGTESHRQLIRALQQRISEQEAQHEADNEELKRQLQRSVAALQAMQSAANHKEGGHGNCRDEEEEEDDDQETKGLIESRGIGAAEEHVEAGLQTLIGVRSVVAAPPEAAGHEETSALHERINQLERQNRKLQKKLENRPIIFQSTPSGSGPLNLEAGQPQRQSWEPWLLTLVGPVARKLRLAPGWERRVSSAAAPLCTRLEQPLRNFTQRLLRHDAWLWVFYVHLLILYAVVASCAAASGSANPGSPAECVEARMKLASQGHAQPR